MKRLSLLLFFIFAFVRSYPESIDSLKAQRERLYTRYSEINLPGKELSKVDAEKSLLILKDVVIADSRIINAYNSYDTKISETEKQLKSLKAENAALAEKLEGVNDRLFIVYIAGGTLVCLLVLALVLLIAGKMNIRKLKKKLGNYNELQQDANKYVQTQQEMKVKLEENEKVLAEKMERLSTLLSENKQLENLLGDAKLKLEEIEKLPPALLTETPKTVHEFNDENMAKLEKLSRMKEMGIITEDEYNTFRKKFIGEI